MAASNHLPNSSQPSAATALGQMLRGSLVTQLIHVAAKLGIADLLQDGPKSSSELAASVQAHPRALYRVLRALASLGIFAEKEHGRFELTPLAEPLQTNAPGSLRGSATFYGERWWWQPCGELLHSVRTGRTAFDQFHGMAIYDYLDQHLGAAEIFNQHQTNMTVLDSAAVVAAYSFTGISTIVDVGGGHGALMAGILKAYPQISGILFDQPSVLEGARRHMHAEGLAERCELVAGNFFESVPSGGDTYVLKDIIHNWDDHQAVQILKNCHRALPRTGRILVVEKVVPPGNEPFAGKLTDITMLIGTGGQERTEAEYHALLNAGGFEVARVIRTQSPESVIEGAPV